MNAPVSVGKEIRDLRKAKRLTLVGMGQATGLSIGHLSEIERGKSSPSIDVLHRIAQALGVTIGWFLHNIEAENPAEREFVVRADKRRKLQFASGITDELLSPHLHGALELVLSRFPSGVDVTEGPYSHEGEEAGLVINGRLDLWVGDQLFELAEGDSFSFPSATPHRFRNPGEDETVVIWAITPPSY